jgi:hypothetical protein
MINVRWLIAVAAAVALGAFAVACGDSEEASPTASSTPTAKPTPTLTATPFHGDPGGETTGPLPSQSNAPVTATPAPGELKTYTDAAYGYSFDYPAAWFLVPPSDKGGTAVLLYSYDPSSVPPEQAGEPVPKDKLKAIFRVEEGVYQPVDEWLAESRAGQPPVNILSSTNVSVDAKGGISEGTESNGVTSTGYYVPMGGGLLFIVGAGPNDSDLWPVFEGVLASVRFP